jgi:hypothetical protein
MSGSSYNYLYRRAADEVGYIGSELHDMGDRLLEASKDDSLERWSEKYTKRVPLTEEDRKNLREKADLFHRVSGELLATMAKIAMLEDLMHDVEWWRSGDFGIGEVIASPTPDHQKIVKSPTDDVIVELYNVSQRRIAALQDALRTLHARIEPHEEMFGSKLSELEAIIVSALDTDASIAFEASDVKP